MASVAVFGASGRTGREVLHLAVLRGHRVIAVVRDPTKLSGLPDIEVRQADVLNPDTVIDVLEGVETVISALGPDDGRRPTRIYSHGMRAITEQMRRSGVRRVVAVSAVPVSATEEKTVFERLVLHPVLWRFFGESYRDLRVMESELGDAGDLDWVVVRPPLLTEGAGTGSVRMAWNAPLRRTRRISRRLLAQTLVETATSEPFRTGVLTVTQAG